MGRRYREPFPAGSEPAPPSPPSAPPPPARGKVRPSAAEAARAAAIRRRWRWRTRASVALLGWGASAAARLLYATLRTRACGLELLRPLVGRERVILAFWHEHLLLMPHFYRRVWWGGRVCVMNSAHRDAEVASRAIGRLGIEVVRGSSTRGWTGGLRGLLDAHRRGCDLAVVPDGPRGPRRRAKPGAVELARAIGAPIVPVAWAASACWRARSWDRMAVPLPFARVVLAVGEPLRVDPGGDRAALEAGRQALEARLDRVAEAAARAVAGGGRG